MDLQEAFDKGFVAVKAYVDKSFDAFERRFLALEAHIKAIPIPANGQDADPEAVAEMVMQRIANQLGAIQSSVDETKTLAIAPEAVKALVDEAVAAIPVPKDGADGTSVTVDDVRPMLEELVAAIPPAIDGQDGAPGKSVEPVEVAEFVMPEIKALVAEAVAAAVAAIPVPKDGADGAPGKDADPEIAVRMVLEQLDTDAIATKAVAMIPAPKDGQDGQDGKDADVEAVVAVVVEQTKELVAVLSAELGQVRETVSALPPVPEPVDKEALVAEVVALIPVPKDGADGAPGEKGDPGPKGEKGDPGKDGISVRKFIRGAEGNLIAIGSDGTTDDLGFIEGKDGAPGKDGRDGKDGADGVGWDDLDETVEDGGRFLVRRHKRGEEVKEFRHQLATPIDRGIYNNDTKYLRGDSVSYGGSSWTAQGEVSGEKPDSGSKLWRLAVKRGRDGRDGVMKEPPSGKVRI